MLCTNNLKIFFFFFFFIFTYYRSKEEETQNTHHTLHHTEVALGHSADHNQRAGAEGRDLGTSKNHERRPATQALKPQTLSVKPGHMHPQLRLCSATLY